MVRRGLFVLLGVVVAAAGPLPSAARTAMVPKPRSGMPAAGRSGRPGRSGRLGGSAASTCQDSEQGGWLAAARRRTARTGARDRANLSHGQVEGLLADLRRSLAARFGDSDEARLANRLSGRIVVPVRFHVISSGGLGRIPIAAVQDQVDTLNAAYGGETGGADTGVTFQLQSTDYTDNDDWFNHPQEAEYALKAALHKGGAGTLNLYTANVGSDVLGFSTFPQWYRLSPTLDGVVVDFRSLPGGSIPHFDRGYTAVHETGHWLGLFHTFENGCQWPGDAVDDTPYEAVPTEGCPLLKDTCPQPGDDPIHNYMDYSYDDCMTSFTPGQGQRIHAVWAAFRGGSARTARRHDNPRHTPG